ncbi:hypothetical protein [Paenibacillus campi]|uniref:CIS tube protein n=1 Tax=Paenibacillus campi TaxID=3106031 RepID=UPI002AFEB1EE|nr:MULTISPECIES: hypothetical protein [unclassified Paenibacillus]
MTTSKALIIPQGKTKSNTGDIFTVMFNPSEYTVVQQGNWNAGTNESKPLQTIGNVAGSLSLSLFFDTSMQGSDVREYAGKLLSMIQEDMSSAKPRTYTFAWGTFEYEGRMEIKEQKYTLFMENGVPLRLRMNITLYREKSLDQKVTAKTLSETDRQVTSQQGESLPETAQKFYGDASKWRQIADASGIDDPLNPGPVSTLTVPGKG